MSKTRKNKSGISSNDAKITKSEYQISYLDQQKSISTESNTQSLRTKFYIQLHISNLFDCFSSGIITPVSYSKNRTCDDIQSKYYNNIIIANGYIESFDNSQCLLEIILKPNEVNFDNEVFLYNKPLPISRVKKIIVFDKYVKEKIINTALSQDVGYIPENLFDYFNDNISKLDLIPSNKSESINYQKEIDIFDRLLGLFAFIKNQQLYYTNLTNEISNYSRHFLEAFSIINNEIELNFSNILKKEFITAYKILFDYNNNDTSQPNAFIVKHIYDNGLIDRDFIDKFFEIFSGLHSDKKTTIDELKSKLLSSTGKKQVLKYLLDINEKFFKVSYLYIYGKKGSNDKEILKNLISEELVFSQSEITLALLGMYYGYKQLRLAEQIIFNDIKIQSIFGKEFNLKFKLDQKIDYVLIESLYEFIFNKNKADKNILAFNPFLKENDTFLKKIKADSDFSIRNQIELFDSYLYDIKKINDFEKTSLLLSSFPEKLEGYFHTVSFVRKHYDKEQYLLRGASCCIFKSEFLKLIAENKIRLKNYDHFIECIELDKKYNLK